MRRSAAARSAASFGWCRPMSSSWYRASTAAQVAIRPVVSRHRASVDAALRSSAVSRSPQAASLASHGEEYS
jgi:hypothetical protein